MHTNPSIINCDQNYTMRFWEWILNVTQCHVYRVLVTNSFHVNVEAREFQPIEIVVPRGTKPTKYNVFRPEMKIMSQCIVVDI